jgi:L-ribulose-5-phosphate 3-epimerase
MRILQMGKSRREFIKTATATTVGAAIGTNLFSNPLETKLSPLPVCAFTKCLQFIDYERLGETLALTGFDGADLPVRPDGYIRPDNVATELPKVVKVLHKSGISVPMMATSIINADDPDAERVLGTASNLGIKYYRTGFLIYDQKKSIQENLDGHKKGLEKLEKINRKYGIHGGYQNHAGTRVGAPLWDLYWILKDFDPAYIGVQYDVCHATCEGGLSWSLGMKLLAPWIKTTDIKDFIWEKVNGKWEIIYLPLGKGIVDFNSYLKAYTRLKISAPISIHFEYDLGGADLGKPNPTMSLQDISVFMETDINWLRPKLKEFGIL